MRPFGNETDMTTRRKLLIGAAASLLCAPAIVRVGSLMPLRGIIIPTDRHYFGFLERLFVHIYMPPIAKLQNTGLSAHGIAAELNRRGSKTTDGDAWDAQRVMSVIRRDEMIRREDAFPRAELVFGARHADPRTAVNFTKLLGCSTTKWEARL